MDENLSVEDQWLDIILSRFEKEGCVVLLCCRENDNAEHIIYQTPRGQLQHVLFRYNGLLEEPTVIVTEKLVMLSPPSRATS